MGVLGTLVDFMLTFHPLLDRTCSRLVSETATLVSTTRDLGLGVPSSAVQFIKRVCPAVLHGTELLASCAVGGPVVARRLNEVMYASGKTLLG